MVSLRLDDELVARLEAFAKDQGISRSMAIRVILTTGLGEPSKVAAARETVEIRKRFVAKLAELVTAAANEAAA